jgi:putative PIN family toxin of toxin-antitoxin system
MLKSKRIKAVIDTNLFVSFLIGKKLQGLKGMLIDFRIELIFAEQNIDELKIVAQRPKFKKYFKAEDLKDLIDLIKTIGKVLIIRNTPDICRDPKDNYLLELSRKGKADYLVTGDSDLYEIGIYKGTKIVTVKEFEQILSTGTKA